MPFFSYSSVFRFDIFDFEPGTGTISGRRPFVEIEPEAGIPDGLTVDAEGGVWLALFGGGAVRRYAPDGAPPRRTLRPGARVVVGWVAGEEVTVDAN